MESKTHSPTGQDDLTTCAVGKPVSVPVVRTFLRSGGMAELSHALQADLDARHEAWLHKTGIRGLEGLNA